MSVENSRWQVRTDDEEARDQHVGKRYLAERRQSGEQKICKGHTRPNVVIDCSFSQVPHRQCGEQKICKGYTRPNVVIDGSFSQVPQFKPCNYTHSHTCASRKHSLWFCCVLSCRVWCAIRKVGSTLRMWCSVAPLALHFSLFFFSPRTYCHSGASPRSLYGTSK